MKKVINSDSTDECANKIGSGDRKLEYWGGWDCWTEQNNLNALTTALDYYSRVIVICSPCHLNKEHLDTFLCCKMVQSPKGWT